VFSPFLFFLSSMWASGSEAGPDALFFCVGLTVAQRTTRFYKKLRGVTDAKGTVRSFRLLGFRTFRACAKFHHRLRHGLNQGGIASGRDGRLRKKRASPKPPLSARCSERGFVSNGAQNSTDLGGKMTWLEARNKPS
jgi:hypothetical protein